MITEQEKLTSTIGEGESKLRSALYETEKRLKEGHEQMTKMAADIDKKAHENPWPVVAGVGFSCLLLGLLIGKSKN
jgi:ElaB/YqjD/DUF883 family membrane-anchored ribosome-binding protein